MPEEDPVYRQVFQTVTSQLEIKDVETFLSPHKKLAAEDLRDELAKPRAAVMTTDGRKLDVFFVRLLKPGTLIIVHKRMKLLGTGAGSGTSAAWEVSQAAPSQSTVGEECCLVGST